MIAVDATRNGFHAVGFVIAMETVSVDGRCGGGRGERVGGLGGRIAVMRAAEERTEIGDKIVAAIG